MIVCKTYFLTSFTSSIRMELKITPHRFGFIYSTRKKFSLLKILFLVAQKFWDINKLHTSLICFLCMDYWKVRKNLHSI